MNEILIYNKEEFDIIPWDLIIEYRIILLYTSGEHARIRLACLCISCLGAAAMWRHCYPFVLDLSKVPYHISMKIDLDLEEVREKTNTKGSKQC